MDKVESRSSKTFVQSLGRVLRNDKLNKKKYGVIIDFHAKNAINICERLNKYINIPDGINPWNFQHQSIIFFFQYKMIRVVINSGRN